MQGYVARKALVLDRAEPRHGPECIHVCIRMHGDSSAFTLRPTCADSLTQAWYVLPVETTLEALEDLMSYKLVQQWYIRAEVA